MCASIPTHSNLNWHFLLPAMLKSQIRQILTTLQEDGIAVFVHGAMRSMIVSILATGIGFLVTVVLAKTLGATQYGLYVYILSWLAVISLGGQLGFTPLLVRFVAAYTAREQWGRCRGILTHTTLVSTGTSIVISLIAGAVVWMARSRFEAENAWTFIFALPLIVLITVSALRAAALRALKRVVYSAVPESIIRPVLIASGVLISAYVVSGPVTARDALLVNILATFAVFLIGTFLLLRVMPPQVRAAKPEYAVAEWWRTSLPMFFSIGMRRILSQTDIILVGSLVGVKEAGIYAVASRLANFAILGKEAADSITAPLISEFYATEQRIQLSRLVIISARAVTAFTLAASIMLLLFGTYILRYFGSEFVAAFVPLLILLLGHLFKASFASAGFLLSMTGFQDYSASISIISAIINLVLNLVLIPLFGLTGAALATALTSAIWSIALMIYARKLLDINPTAFARAPALPTNQ